MLFQHPFRGGRGPWLLYWTIVRCREVELRADRYNAGRINTLVARVVMGLDVLHVHRLIERAEQVE